MTPRRTPRSRPRPLQRALVRRSSVTTPAADRCWLARSLDWSRRPVDWPRLEDSIRNRRRPEAADGWLPTQAARQTFHGTLRENVDLGRQGIGQSRVREVLQQVGLSRTVLQLPDGLEHAFANRWLSVFEHPSLPTGACPGDGGQTEGPRDRWAAGPIGRRRAILLVGVTGRGQMHRGP